MSSKFNDLLKLGVILLMASQVMSFTSEGETGVSNNKDKRNSEVRLNHDTFGLSNMFEAITTLFLSGLFDRSFFITGFMAIKYSKLVVLISATAALTIIGVLSVFLGVAINKYVPTIWIDIFSVALFLFFGVKMMIEAYQMNKNEDLAKLEEHHRIRNEEEEGLVENEKITTENNHHGHGHLLEVQKECENFGKGIDHADNTSQYSSFQVASKIFLLVFASEIGDRSQISTIFLTNNFDKIIVIIAVFVSQLILTIIAIFGGVLISTKISERNLTFIAASTFLAFGVVAFYVVCVNEIFTNSTHKPTYNNEIMPDRRTIMPYY